MSPSDKNKRGGLRSPSFLEHPLSLAIYSIASSIVAISLILLVLYLAS
jgi:hypothetical protein